METETIFIRRVRIIDPSRQVDRVGDLLLGGGEILAAGRLGRDRVPEGARVINGNGLDIERRALRKLYALDLETRESRNAAIGAAHYSSVSASRDGRRVVATVVRRRASLFTVPIGPAASTVRSISTTWSQ